MLAYIRLKESRKAKALFLIKILNSLKHRYVTLTNQILQL